MAVDVPEARVPDARRGPVPLAREDSRSLEERDAAGAEGEGNGEGKQAARTRVPRPMGMDFALRPQSLAVPAASNKHSKDSVKGKLADKMAMVKKKVATQATSLSIEGRNMDRL